MPRPTSSLKQVEERFGIVSTYQHDDSSCAASSCAASQMTSDAPWTPALTVTGSPVDELNGVYKQCGYFDFVPKYIKITECQGKQDVIMIYRCKVSETSNETSKRWYISIGTPDNGVYFIGGKEGSRKPPVKGWVNIASIDLESKLRTKSNL